MLLFPTQLERRKKIEGKMVRESFCDPCPCHYSFLRERERERTEEEKCFASGKRSKL